MRLMIPVLAGLFFGMAGPVAHAADLPPAPVLDDSDEPAGSGWYLRGDIGVDQPLVRHGHDGGSPTMPPLNRARFDRDLVLGGGVGYQVAPWFRADLTIDHRFGAAYKGSRFGAGSSSALDRADFDATTFLANGYIDLPLWSGITPYIGAGIGFSRNRFDGAERATSAPNAPGSVLSPLPSRTETVLAWALMGGVAVDLTGNVRLDLGYRYSRLGAARTRWAGSEPPLQTRETDAHEFRIGARYLLN